MQIRGKLALVTGASSGIGAVTAQALAKKGASVILIARREAALKKVATAIEEIGGKAYIYPVDLSDNDATVQVMQQIKSEVGLPDILVNNAGTGQWKATYETTHDELLFMTQLPYLAAYTVTQAFLKEMLERNSGHIVNITSAAAILYIPGASAYCTARWAMRSFTGCLHSDLRGTGVNASLVMPAKVGDTDYFLVNKGSEERIPSIERYYRTLTGKEVAQGIIKAVEKKKKMVILPFMLQLTFWAQPFMPSFVQWLVERTGWSYKK